MTETTITETGEKAVVFDVRELRIGNILLWKGRYVHVTSLSLDIDDEYEDSIGFCYLGKNTDEMGGWVRNICADLKPVELTSDILKPISNSFLFAEVFKIVINEEGVFMEQYGEGLEQLKNIQYYHQLQNIIYVLTDKTLSFTS